MGLLSWLKASRSDDDHAADQNGGRPRPTTLEEMRAAAAEAGVSREGVERIIAAALPSAALIPDVDGDVAEIGGPRLGGLPDLPPDVQWPEGPNGTLDFVMQLPLDRLPTAVLDDGGLPHEGMLSVFYDVCGEAYGSEPEDREHWRLVWTAPDQPLVRHARPVAVTEHEEVDFPSVALVVREELTFPSSLSPIFEGDDGDGFAYCDLEDSFADADGDVSRLLGNADAIQGGMEAEAAMATGRPESDAASWRLLMQICSEDAAEMLWGDVGMLYILMPEDSMRAHRWEDAWLVMECS